MLEGVELRIERFDAGDSPPAVASTGEALRAL